MDPYAPEREVEAMVVVKAAPTPSKKTGETVCVAAVEISAAPSFLRLYPIDFRGLRAEQQFHKGDVIRFTARRPRQDPRPESWCPERDTIRVIDRLPRWRDRWPLLEPLVSASMCELSKRERAEGTSLGIFRPQTVKAFRAIPTTSEWDAGRAAALNQTSLLPSPRKRPLEKIPYKFSYRYACSDPGCRGHSQQIIDWEVVELYRKTRGRPQEERIRLVREKWLEQICATDRETYFFAGTVKDHPHSFILLGAFWPLSAELRRTVRHEQLALV